MFIRFTDPLISQWYGPPPVKKIRKAMIHCVLTKTKVANPSDLEGPCVFIAWTQVSGPCGAIKLLCQLHLTPPGTSHKTEFNPNIPSTAYLDLSSIQF